MNKDLWPFQDLLPKKCLIVAFGFGRMKRRRMTTKLNLQGGGDLDQGSRVLLPSTCIQIWSKEKTTNDDGIEPPGKELRIEEVVPNFHQPLTSFLL